MKENNISVVLNVYKRPYALEKQIQAILNQSIDVSPQDIHIWYNMPEEGSDQKSPDISGIKTYKCNYNTKFFGRFLIPLLCKTEYIAMFDDDTIPQKDWLKNCVDTMKTHEGILGGSGILTSGTKYNPHIKVGWNGQQLDNVKEVDLVGHAWFFKQEWTRYLWDEPPVSWDNGEDIMFSYVCQKHGIKTYVPPHPKSNTDLWSTSHKSGMELGCDPSSSWLKKPHNNQRDNIVIELKRRGWKTIK